MISSAFPAQIACAIQKWLKLQQVHVGSLTSMITHWTPCHLCKLHSPLDHHRQVGGDYDLKATKLWLRSLAHILEHHLDSDTILNSSVLGLRKCLIITLIITLIRKLDEQTVGIDTCSCSLGSCHRTLVPSRKLLTFSSELD